MLRRYCMAVCKNPTKAEDLVQDTVLCALEKHATNFDGGNLGAWLTVIARNRHRSEHRKWSRIEEDPDNAKALQLVYHATPQIHLEAQEALTLVAKLPGEMRDTLMVVVDGASYEEAAVELLVQEGTVKSRVNRAREILKQGTAA